MQCCIGKMLTVVCDVGSRNSFTEYSREARGFPIGRHHQTSYCDLEKLMRVVSMREGIRRLRSTRPSLCAYVSELMHHPQMLQNAVVFVCSPDRVGHLGVVAAVNANRQLALCAGAGTILLGVRTQEHSKAKIVEAIGGADGHQRFQNLQFHRCSFSREFHVSTSCTCALTPSRIQPPHICG